MGNDIKPEDWTLAKAKSKYPYEITQFIDELFQILEVRQRVGETKGIVFEVRTKEKNHNIPHLHAKYGEFNISIEIETGKKLAGNLPDKQYKTAKKWIYEHKDKLLNDWSGIVISAKSETTKSKLSQ